MKDRYVKPLLLASRGIQAKIGERLIKSMIIPEFTDRLLIITIDDYGVNDHLIQAAQRIS